MGLFFKSASEKAYEALHDKIVLRYRALMAESPLKEPFEIALMIWTEEMRGKGAPIYSTPAFASPLLKFVVVLESSDGLRMLAQLVYTHIDEKFRDTAYGSSLDQNLGTLVHIEKTECEELNRVLKEQNPKSYAMLRELLGKNAFYPGSLDNHASRLFPRSVVASLYGCDSKGRRL